MTLFNSSRRMVVLLFVFVLVAGIAAYLIYAYNITEKGVKKGQIVNLSQTAKPNSEVEETENNNPVDYEVVEVVRDLYVPWSIAFTSEDRFLVSERNGKVRQVVNDQLVEAPLIVLPEVAEIAEAGLLGIALHPNYTENKFVYACITYESGNGLADKIERFVDNGDSLSRDRIILDSFPAARFHAGCRLAFGPDGKLYATAGDATTRDEAQNLGSLAGKILRMNEDGSVPSDNPFGTLVWSYGHRNPQGIDWHPSGTMYSTEHGPSGNDGPGGGDEVNVISKGANYGWPVVSHEKSSAGMVDPKLVFTPAEAPASGMFYSGSTFPQFKNNFFFGALRGAGIFRVVVSEKNPEEIISYEKMDINFGRIREIAESPDGLIYFTTSNRDGRGQVRDGDDKIYRFEPR